MKRYILKALVFLGMLLPLIPCGAARAEGFVDVKTLREQADMRWQQTIVDAYGREIAVDVRPIMPDAPVVPILRATKPACTADGMRALYGPSRIQTTEEDFGTILSFADPETGDRLEVRLFSDVNRSVCVDYENLKTKIEGDPSKLESLTGSGDAYCSNQVERTRAYLDGYEMTVQDCLDTASAALSALFPVCPFDLELMWVEAVPNSRPLYACRLRQKMHGIPVLMSASDPVRGLGEERIPFKKPDSWKGEEVFRLGDFIGPMWDFFAYADGGYFIQCVPLAESGVVCEDVPLCGMERVLRSVEERIEAGNIRSVHALRFGYCCYRGEDDGIVLYPVWEVECDYYYDPKEATKDYRELEDAPVTSGLRYRTMTVNAQTGAFMDPFELREKLTDCPEIITWEEAGE